MKVKKAMKRLAVPLVLLLCFLGTQAMAKPDPFSKMPQMTEITTGWRLPSDPKIPEGEALENNDVYKWLEKNLNIRTKYLWTTSDQNQAYEQKINLLIASNDIPDILNIDVEPYGFNILRKLISNDMIMDLTKVYNDYASPTLKEFHGKSKNVALKAVTFNGKLMALPSLSDIETAVPIIWVRQDWLDELKLKGPKTLDDVASIVKAFQSKKGSPALPSCDKMFLGDTASFDFMFGAYNAYPGNWIKDKKGKVAYGSVQPETKNALAKLAAWYKEGIIDAEFALKDPDKAVETVKANKSGIFQGAWWSAWWPIQDSKKLDPKVNWKPYFIKGVDGGYHARSYPVVRSFVVVRKGFKNPEAIMKLANWYEESALKRLDWYNNLIGPGGKYNQTAVNFWPVNACGAKYLDEISRRYKAIMDVLNGRASIDKADAETKFQAEMIQADQKNPGKDIGTWCMAHQWDGAAVFVQNNIKQVIPAFAGSTELMVRKKALLEDLERKTFLEIIMGKAPLSKFDEFVKQWNDLGGRDITAEINEIVKQ